MTGSDYSHFKNLSGLIQKYIKSDLASAFTSKEIVTAVEIDWHGRINIKKQTWDLYWGAERTLPEQDCFLRFKEARDKYFDSGFQLSHIGNYCYQYFVLLSKWLNSRNGSRTHELLSKLLSLENFEIRWYGDKSGIAAGTTSHRNPEYLLVRLCKKSSNADPKYLPIIMLKSSFGNKLFYHYRQYRISDDPDFSIFMYPATNLSDRGESFTLIESFAGGFSRKSDPRSKPRAKLLAENAIYPFLKTSLAKDNNENSNINMADLGGGSGVMLRHIREYVIGKDCTAKENWYLSGSVVGLRIQNLIRHFSKGPIRANMSYLDYQQMDYVDWINHQPETVQWDVILMCRLLNNLSLFEIDSTESKEVLCHIAGRQNSPEVIIGQKYNPICCLKPKSYCPENLIHKNTKTRLSDDCSVYNVLSLSDYYKAIAVCMDVDIVNERYYYPVRKFNSLSLLNSEDKSIIGKLSKIAKLIVIEDVDLTGNILINHIQNYRLNCAVSAVNTNLRYSSQVFAVCDRRYESMLPGRKIQ